MTDEGRTDETQASRPSAGQWAIILFVALALVASLLMVLGDDLSTTATLAVIAALWAAVIGALLVTKYRRLADTAESRSRDLRLVYELQLEREIAARRQYESDVESAIRHEVATESNQELDELKTQVLALRASLEELLGRPLPDTRIALGLDKPRELGSGLSGASYVAVADDRAAAERDFASTAPPSDAGRHMPAQAAQDETPAVEMTEIIPVVTDDPAEQVDEPEVEAAAEVEAEPEPEREQHPAPQQWRPQVQPQQAPQQAQPQQAQPQGSRRGPQRPQGQQRPYGQQRPQGPVQGQPQRNPQAPQHQNGPHAGGAQTGPHQRAAFAAGAYEPPSGPMRQAPQQAQPQQDQGRPQQAEPEQPVDDGAHVAGSPASELLKRLRESSEGYRQSEGYVQPEGGGGRRRRD